MNQTFTVDNLNIYVSFSYNIIFLKITNNLIFSNYELTIYESTIKNNKFKIDELYTFIIKSFKKEDNHIFTCSILENSMNISMTATFNLYFKLNYEIILDKKDDLKIDNLKFGELKFGESKVDELKLELNILKDKYEKLLLNVDSLNKIINTLEISIGYFKYDSNKIVNILSLINNDSLIIKPSVKNIIPVQIIIYFSKIKKLLKLTQIFISNNIPIILYDDDDCIINSVVLDEYCKNNNIKIIVN